MVGGCSEEEREGYIYCTRNRNAGRMGRIKEASEAVGCETMSVWVKGSAYQEKVY